MITLYVCFLVFVAVFLALDLGVFHRESRVLGIREAFAWSAVSVVLALGFAVFVHYAYSHGIGGLGTLVDHADGVPNTGKTAAAKFLTGYLIELSLSVDNLFVMAVVFSSFGVPGIYQHRVLFWGILGALVMRGAMIAAGAFLVARFHWVLYLFGAFLIYTAWGMLRFKVENPDPLNNPLVRVARRFLPVTRHFHGEHFFVRAGSAASREPTLPSGARADADPVVVAARPGTLLVTPLFLSLLVVEACDVIFAVDSVPAIFSITTDPFLVFTSNVFAILGLRSLFFALAGMLNRFHLLEVSLAAALAMVGAKMLVGDWVEQWIGHSIDQWVLALVGVILLGGIVASLVVPPPEDDGDD